MAALALPAIPVSTTPLRGATVVLPGQTPGGKYILSVLLKRTYQISHDRMCTRAAKDTPLSAGDVYWDDPMNSSIRYESDFIPHKLATDVVLNGKVYAPGGYPVASCLASLEVAGKRRDIMTIGNRTALFAEGGAPVFTNPEPFTEIDLRYEFAYGGIDVYSDKTTSYPYPRNPLGRGFVVKNSAKALRHLDLPNFEQPDQPLTPETLCLEDYANWEKQPFPAGFGWFPKTWLPRALRAGILPADRATEQELRRAYAQLVPAAQREAYLTNSLPDINFEFFNGASRGFVLPYLEGGERIVTDNLSPEGSLSFQLPPDRPHLGLDIGSGIQEPEVVMHSAMIRMEDRLVDLVWRGGVEYNGPDWLPWMRKMEVLVS